MEFKIDGLSSPEENITLEFKTKKINHCSDCNAVCNRDDLFSIDNRQVCKECLFGKVLPFEIYPIGFVKNNLRRDSSSFGRSGAGNISRIELFPSQKQFLSGLDQEPNITIVYYLHESRSVKILFNRGLDGKRVGVFASRTPDRLSKIGIQDVTLMDVKATTVIVKGLDAINGTPVLDIKLKI